MKRSDFGEIKSLRVDRSLLNYDFDHYLLANRKPEMRKIDLPSTALQHLPSAQQWGFQHVKMFSSVERLILDLSIDTEDHLYVFTETGALIKVVYKSNLANFASVTEVLSLPLPADKSNCFPPSLVFADKKYAIVSNGNGSLMIYNTHDRSTENQRWTEVFSYTLMSDSTVDNFVLHNTIDNRNASGVAFCVLDCRSKDENTLSILLQTVMANKNVDDETTDNKVPFYTRLIWLDIEMSENEPPKLARHRELNYGAHLELATLNHNAQELITIGPVPPVFAYDSLSPVNTTNELDAEETTETTEKVDSKPIYVWTQDAEEITVTFASAEPISRKDVNYQLTSDTVSVSIKGIELLSGKLEGAVHLDSSTWSIIDQTNLQITLFKVRGHFWRELVKEDIRGLYQQDPEKVAQVLESLDKFTSDTQAMSSRGAQSSTLNADQLEECDNTGEEMNFICWVDGNEHRCIQTIDTSCSQILFDMRLTAGGPRTFATREDNDGIVWSLDELDLETGQRVCHKHTLNAFGYVQAGHSQKLFSGCAPDGNYAVVVHTNNHAFIYLQNVPVANGCQLRNRKTEKKHQNISEQLVLNTAALFDQTVESPTFIGFRPANNVLFLLTRGHIVAAHIRS
ncbi:NudC domain-containing protein 1 [Aphelenchoides besseyi]|nr:NudC domain-containing protein 1 [Aphelenchoides besseyi]